MSLILYLVVVYSTYLVLFYMKKETSVKLNLKFILHVVLSRKFRHKPFSFAINPKVTKEY